MRKWFMLLILMGVVVACTPIAPTALPVATITLSVPQTFSGTLLTGGTLTVQYPETWVQTGSADNLILGSSASIAQNPSADMLTGGAGVTLILIPKELAGLSVPDGVTPDAVSLLNAQLAVVRQTAVNATFSDVTTRMLNNRLIAEARGTDNTDDTILWSVDIGQAFVIFFGVTKSGEMVNFESTFSTILNSVTFTR
jgi:hypothetical protein